mmetsp:Transcript_8006/g.18908  ORF Transcript_8006/g.18908 Transcript_8006/m.18908 type:complete len:317 (-) Transcript_8006:336-1286(-)
MVHRACEFNPSAVEVTTSATRSNSSFGLWFARAKAQTMFAISPGLHAATIGNATLAVPSKKGWVRNPKVPKAQAMLERSCGLKDEKDETQQRCTLPSKLVCCQPIVAQAQALLAKACGVNDSTCSSAAAITSAMNLGSSLMGNCIVPTAHKVLATPWAVSSPSFWWVNRTSFFHWAVSRTSARSNLCFLDHLATRCNAVDRFTPFICMPNSPTIASTSSACSNLHNCWFSCLCLSEVDPQLRPDLALAAAGATKGALVSPRPFPMGFLGGSKQSCRSCSSFFSTCRLHFTTEDASRYLCTKKYPAASATTSRMSAM